MDDAGNHNLAYARWRSVADYDAFQREPAVQEPAGHIRDFMREAGVRTESGVFEVAFSVGHTTS